jgi:hypothetical protein
MVLWGFNQIRYFRRLREKTQLSPILGAIRHLHGVVSLSAIPVAGALAMTQRSAILIDLFGKRGTGY